MKANLDTFDRYNAIREAHAIKAEDDYFAPRPVEDGAMQRRAFNAGFTRGFDARDRLNATPAAPTSGEPWQPIETAPPECGRNYLVCIVHENMEPDYCVAWLRSDMLWDGPEGFVEPTHWMPLPAAPGATPPSAAQAEGAKRLVSDLVQAVVWQERMPNERNQNAYRAARDAVEAALTAAPEKLEGPRERETLLRVIQMLNQNPYSLTKSECIEVVREMMDAAPAPHQQAGQAAEYGDCNYDRCRSHGCDGVCIEPATPPSPQQTPDPEHAWGSCQTAAIKTLTALGYTWDGSAQWTAPQQAAQGGERERTISLDQITPEMEKAFQVAFIDQIHNRKHTRGQKPQVSAEVAGLRAMLAAAPAARAAQGGREGLTALTDEEFLSLMDSDGIGPVDPSMALTIKELVERAHGIGITTPAGGSELPTF